MKLVIDIPENLYKAAINGLNAEEIWDLRVAITDGTPLPKDHGRLIDVSELLLSIMRYMDGDKTLGQCIDDTPTVIEASEG